MKPRCSPSRRRGWRFVACFLALGPAGCITQWEVQPVPVPAAVATSPNDQFRITLRDGTSLQLEKVSVVGDSLTGSTAVNDPWPATSPRVAIPLADIATISRREPNLAASILLGTIAGVTLLFAILFAG